MYKERLNVRAINYIGRISGDDQLSYYLYNGHEDVVQTVSEAGEVENQYDYDIFGNPILTVEVYANAIRYAGEFFDAETGLYYLRARYYNPYTGRFISEDSYWGEDANPLSLNLYTYAYNNPIMYVDPSGHIPIIEDIIDAIMDFFDRDDRDDKDDRENDSKEDQKDEIIKEIDKQKEIWLREESGAGKNRVDWTEKQREAHERAEGLRRELARLEEGNELVERLVRERGQEAGTWEEYKRDRKAKEIESKRERGERITEIDRAEYIKLDAMVKVSERLRRDVSESLDADEIISQIKEDWFGDRNLSTADMDAVLDQTLLQQKTTKQQVVAASNEIGGKTVRFKLNEFFRLDIETQIMYIDRYLRYGEQSIPEEIRTQVIVMADMRDFSPGGAGVRIVRMGKAVITAINDVKVAKAMNGARGTGEVAKETRVIGHYPEYIEKSKELGTKPYSIPDNVWNKMTKEEQWAANQKFLDRAIAKDAEFVLATPLDKVRPGSYLQKEIEYLLSHGYKLSTDGTKLIKK